MTRRTLLAAGAAGAGAAALAACSPSSGSGGSGGSSGSGSQPAGRTLVDLTAVPVGGAKAVKLPDGTPGVVARPPEPSGLLSAFLSNLLRELAAGRTFTCPVGADGRTWLMSRSCCWVASATTFTGDSFGRG